MITCDSKEKERVWFDEVVMIETNFRLEHVVVLGIFTASCFLFSSLLFSLFFFFRVLTSTQHQHVAFF